MNYEVCAIDANTGSQRWIFSIPYDSVSVWTYSPAIANGMVYFGSEDMNFYALDALTGVKRWSSQLASGILTTFSMPYVVNGVVCVGMEAFNESIYGLDTQTGTRRWKYGASGDGVPRLTVANGVLYVSEADNNVFAFDPATGAKQWTFQVNGNLMYEYLDGASPPVAANGLVYVGADDGYVYAIEA